MADNVNEEIKLHPKTIVSNRYIIKSLIAKGGMASTYLAEDKKTKELVVLKVLSIRQIENWKTLDLFKREISVLKNINHPQIPDYIDHFDLKLNGATYYILVQEYVDGNNLYNLIKNGKKFTIKEIRHIFISLLKILSYIHHLNPTVIHRDINPKNIIINKKGIVYLVDFSASGYIKKTTLAAARSDTFVGTIGYMPPEQFYGKVLPQSDLYAIGVTVIFLLTGMEPFEFELNDLRIDYYPYTDIPEYLEKLLDLLIDPNSSKRPGSAEEALELLEKQYPGEIVHIEDKRKQEKAGKKPLDSDPLLNELYDAILKKNKGKVKKLITKGAPVNTKGSENKPPVKLALEMNHLAIARILLKYGADVNAIFRGRTFLHNAVLSGKKEQVLLLLKNQAAVNIRSDRGGKTALDFAIKKGNYKIYNLLIKYGAKATISNKKNGQTQNHPSLPRHVPFNVKLRVFAGGGAHIAGWICLSIGIVGFIFFGSVFGSVFGGLLFYFSDTSEVQGNIESVEHALMMNENWNIYAHHYRYYLAEYGEISGVSYAEGSGYSVGAKVNIEYLKNDPQTSRIKGMRTAAPPYFAIFIIGPIVISLLILGFVLVLKNIIKGIKNNILLKSGVVAYGELISATATNVSINDAIVYKMVFEFGVRDRKYRVFVKSHLTENFSSKHEKLVYNPAHPYQAVIVNSLPKVVKWFFSNSD